MLIYQILLVCIQINENYCLKSFLIDWRTKGCVVHIKDQGQCGSCWAFAAVGSIESAYCIKTGKLVSLSEQQLVDCSQKEGNMGCNGGLMDYAFQYIIDAGGIVSESAYPYQARGFPCKFNASGVIVKVCGFVDIPSKDENALEQAVANIGPMAVAIDAAHSSFQLYRSGGMYFS
jgi:cathepsin L